MLTSNAREVLRGVETIIIDEIHALVPTKRGAHLALSLERLALRCEQPPQRIGLSATQRPLEEVARFLGGSAVLCSDGRPRPSGARDSMAVAESSSRPGAEEPDDDTRSKTRRLRDSMAVVESSSRPVAEELDDDNSSTRRLDDSTPRPVTIVNTGEKKQLILRVEVPVEDMARLAELRASRAARRRMPRGRLRSGRPFIRACSS